MYEYRLYGLKVKSDIEFKQLVKHQVGMPDEPCIYVEKVDVPDDLKAIKERKYEIGENFSWLCNNTTWLLVENGEKIGYCLTGGGYPAYLQSYILGFGMAMLAMQRGMLAIHCSAVFDEKGAVLIAGESGAGKSTVTTAFLEKGYHLMADDMAFVEVGKDKKAMAKPAFPYQKLCRNVASQKGHTLDDLIYINEEKDKFLVPYEGEFFLGDVPIKAFVMLGVNDTEEVVAKEMTGFNRVPVYTNNLFLRHLLKRDKYNPAIAQKCVEMAAAVPTFYVARPKEGDTVSEVVKKVFEFVENGGDANV